MVGMTANSNALFADTPVWLRSGAGTRLLGRANRLLLLTSLAGSAAGIAKSGKTVHGAPT
jgi:hypothetical protein